MANDARQRQNNIQGTLSSTLTAAATTMVSAGLANLQAITSTQHVAIVLDPGRANGAPEIVYVTAHTAASTKATVARGKEGTAARTHPTPLEAWLHAPTNFDYNLVKTSTSRPSAPVAGQMIWERDKTAQRVFDGSSWKRVTVSPPTAQVTRLASQTFTASQWSAIAWSSKNWDTNSMFATTGTKITCKTAGKFLCTFTGGVRGSTTGSARAAGLRKNSTGTGIPANAVIIARLNSPTLETVMSVSQVVSLTTGQFMEAVVWSDGSSNGVKVSTGVASKPVLTMLWLST